VVDSRGLIERANGGADGARTLDAQEAFTHLRHSASSAGQKLAEVAREVAAGLPATPRANQAAGNAGQADQGRHCDTKPGA
jgi:hypothetical protein